MRAQLTVAQAALEIVFPEENPEEVAVGTVVGPQVPGQGKHRDHSQAPPQPETVAQPQPGARVQRRGKPFINKQMAEYHGRRKDNANRPLEQHTQCARQVCDEKPEPDLSASLLDQGALAGIETTQAQANRESEHHVDAARARQPGIVKSRGQQSSRDAPGQSSTQPAAQRIDDDRPAKPRQSSGETHAPGSPPAVPK